MASTPILNVCLLRTKKQKSMRIQTADKLINEAGITLTFSHVTDTNDIELCVDSIPWEWEYITPNTMQFLIIITSDCLTWSLVEIITMRAHHHRSKKLFYAWNVHASNMNSGTLFNCLRSAFISEPGQARKKGWIQMILCHAQDTMPTPNDMETK